MSAFPQFIDSRYIEKLCLCAFIHRELAKAEISSLKGIGTSILNDEDTIYIRENLLNLISYFHTNGLIMKNVSIMSKRSKKILEKINLIQKSIDKIIKNNSNAFYIENSDNMSWIPSLFGLSILKKLHTIGIIYYPSDIDLDKCLELMLNNDKCSNKEKMAYWKIAREVLIKLKYLES